MKRRLAAGEHAAGLWSQSGSATLAAIAVMAGFEAVVIDNEHGPAALETTLAVMRAVEAAGGSPIVRAPGNDPLYLERLLDLGAASVMVPMIESAEVEEEAAVAACRYPPRGRRGYAAASARAASYGLDRDHVGHAHDDL